MNEEIAKFLKKYRQDEEVETVKEGVPSSSPSSTLPREISQEPCGEEKSATKIQAWWRGTLVRRTLLLAALCASVIQRWWRQLQAQQLEEQRRVMLEAYVRQKRAAVRLQAWVRMWLVRLRYRRLLQAARVIQACWRYHSCHTSGFFQGRYELTAHQLELELEIFLGSQICRITECIPLPIKN